MMANKVIIDSLSKLPSDIDLVIFIGCTPEDAAVTFRECMAQEARVVYSYTRASGKTIHYIPLDGAVPDWGGGCVM